MRCLWIPAFLTLPLSACTPPTDPPADGGLAVDVTVDEPTGTMMTVRWQTEEPAEAWLDYGPDDSYGASLLGWSSDDGLEHAVVLGGLDPGRAWHWRARSEGAGTEVSADQSFEPPYAPKEVPEPAVAGWIDDLVVAPVFGSTRGIVVYNAYGHAVWWHLVEGEGAITQARPTRDGRGLRYASGGELRQVNFAVGDPILLHTVENHHDFLEMEDGVLATLRSQYREVDGVVVAGDALVELREDGTEREVWNSWDSLEPPSDPEALPWEREGIRDWTHLNSLAFYGDQYWLSSFTLDTLFLVNRETGALTARIGGDESDYRLTGGDGFGPQHAPLPLDHGFLVFDNHSAKDEEPDSEVTEYLFGPNQTYSELWSFGEGQGVSAVGLGNVEILPSDDRLIGWGSAGRISAVSREKDVVWQADFDVGVGVGFVHPITLSPIP